MKTLKCFLILFSFIGLMFYSCTDEPESPLSPSDQISLQKNFTNSFTGLNIPTGTTDPGITKNPDGKTMLLKYKGPTLFTRLTGDGPDYLSGPGEIEINGITDFIPDVNEISDFSSMTGHWRGKLILSPDEASGGEWEMTWHGPSVCSETAYLGSPGYILSLQMVGHGKAGDIAGMQIRIDATVYCDYYFQGWYADFAGVIKSH